MAMTETDVTDEVSSQHSPGRREFLKLATLNSAALLLASEFAHSAPNSAFELGKSARALGSARHAVLHSLAPGTIEAKGWLALYLRKQAKGLTGRLPEISLPFKKAYWAGNEDTGGREWWGWEQKGYWIDGALRCALVLQDPSLLKAALHPIHFTLEHVSADGYLGPDYLRKPEERWPHTVFFRALAAHGEATQDPRIAQAIRRHYLADRGRQPAIYDRPERGCISNIEGMLWTYGQTGDRELLAMAQQVWDQFLKSIAPAARETWDLHPQRVLAGTRIHSHGVSYAEIAKLPAILYLHTGNMEYLRYAIAAQERMFTHHMLIDGIPSSAEEFRGIDALDAHETCNLTDMPWGWGYLLMATGDGLWADRIERACFNAGFGSIRKDWKGVQYMSSPNQVIATHDSSHVVYGYGGLSAGWMAFRPNPGYETACCGGNVHRFLPNYVIRMWMSDGKGGLAAVLYGASTARLRLGGSGEPVEIEQETNYPFEEQIHFTVRAARPVKFPLSLRIPGWCEAPRLALNGSPLELPQIEKGFVRIVRTFRPGDRLTLTLPMTTSVSFWPRTWSYTALGLEHGPLVYALPIKENWTSAITADYSTAEFPDWNATAASAWNYGVSFGEKSVPPQVSVVRLPMTEDPWVNPPVQLMVPMQKIPGWVLRIDPNHPDRRQTPAVPGPEIPADPLVEQVPLVPYGATHLRISIFPQV
jgi:hypothetical protein